MEMSKVKSKKQRPIKKKQAAVKVARKPRVDPRIEYTYEQEVTFMCPVRGKVTQVVTIKRFKTLSDINNKHVVAPDAAIDKLDSADDGLSIYGDDDAEAEHKE